jgi:hypothetical protein
MLLSAQRITPRQVSNQADSMCIRLAAVKRIFCGSFRIIQHLNVYAIEMRAHFCWLYTSRRWIRRKKLLEDMDKIELNKENKN